MILIRLCLLLLALLTAACGNNSGTAVNTPSSGPPGPPTGKLTASKDAGGATTSSIVNGVNLPLNAGWNGVGLQCQQVTQLNTNPLVPGMAVWDGSTYVIRNFSVTDINAEQKARRGFWVFAIAPTLVTYSGIDDGLGNFVNLGAGWNYVNFTTSVPFPGAGFSVTKDGSSVPLNSVVLPQFSQVNSDNTYTQVDVNGGGTIQPGRPYWVFAATAVRLEWPNPTPGPSPTPSGTPTPGASPGASPASSPSASPNTTPTPSASP